MDYLGALESDYRRLGEVSEGNLGAPVPSCPEWTVDDLVRHVAFVYLHKVACMQQNAMPEQWPPDLSGEATPDLLKRAYAELRAEFDARPPSSEAATWYDPDQTVGFWIRRLAHETVIHRIDAELADGTGSWVVPSDLAMDGVDELLECFLAWGARSWPEEFADELSKGEGSVLVSAGPAAWLVSWDSKGIRVVRSLPSAIAADGRVDGSPDAVLRWLWGRVGDSAVYLSGKQGKVIQLRELLRIAAQ